MGNVKKKNITACIYPVIQSIHLPSIYPFVIPLVIYPRCLLASQSDAHRIAPHRDPIHPTHPNPTYSSEARKTHDVIYFRKGNRTRTSKTMFPSEKQEPSKPRKPRNPRKARKPRKPIKTKNQENQKNLKNQRNLKKPKNQKNQKNNKKQQKTTKNKKKKKKKKKS